MACDGWGKYRTSIKAYLSVAFPSFSQDDKEDIAQIVCYRTVKAGKPPRNGKWAQFVARNAAVDLLRNRNCHQTVEYDAVFPTDDGCPLGRMTTSWEPFQEYALTTADTEYCDLEMMLGMLPDHYRESLERRMMGYDANDLSELYGGSVAKHKAQLNRAQKAMRRIYVEGQNQ